MSDAASGIPWRCFHCDELFIDKAAAAEHFGTGPMQDPACAIGASERGLVGMIREQEAELRRYREDDHAAARTFHALGAEHATKERRAEEAGFATCTQQVVKPLVEGLAREWRHIDQEVILSLTPGVNLKLWGVVSRNLLVLVRASGFDVEDILTGNG